MADGNDAITTQPPPRGCLSRALVLALMLAAAGLGVAMYFMAQPQDLSHIHGYAPNERPQPSRNLGLLLQNSLDRAYPVTFTEGEVNGWLQSSLQARQGGLFAEHVALDGVWLRLEEGRAEVVLERKLWGHPLTVSMYLQVEHLETDQGTTTEVQFHGGEFHPYVPFPKCGGRFGRLPVPQGFLHLLLPAFKKLAAVFPEELRLGFVEMPRVNIADGHITFDPRGPKPIAVSPPSP
ncbi:MAG: hypothetical protein DVB26_01555 [Verrucomicrobia bacterium]|nr:MAG: hypothetical protein DVB26_01555 [Verrucomicrobiota bacterium]